MQTLQQTMQGTGQSQQEMEEKMRKLQQMKQQEEEFDKHLAQTVSVNSKLFIYHIFLFIVDCRVLFILLSKCVCLKN